MFDNNTTTTAASHSQNHHPNDTNKKISPPPLPQASLKQNDFQHDEEEKKSEEYNDTIKTPPPPQSLQPPQSLKQQQQQKTPTSQTSSSSSYPTQKQEQGSIPLLILCATGICTCYLSYGILHERLFSPSYYLYSSFHEEEEDNGTPPPITAFLVWIGMFCNVFVAKVWIWIECFWKKKEEEGVGVNMVSLNHGLLLLTSFCYVAAMTASNESLNYVSYPTVVLAKSSKLIPTMIMGYFIEHKAYSIKEWLGASLITVGIVTFNFSRMSSSSSSSSDDDEEKENDSVYGLALLAFSLSMDGLLSSCQGMAKKNGGEAGRNGNIQYRSPTAMETMLYTNLYATIFLTPLCIYSGQLSNGIRILTKSTTTTNGDGLSVIQLVALVNASAAAGQVFIFFTIHYFSPLVCTTITTTRKFFTILLSVRNFGHVFNGVQWCSIFMAFGGLYFEIVSKNIGGGGGGGKKVKKD